jgi:6-phosphofructokinase 1
MKKIGIITSGGDCGGLNAVVKGAAQMAHKSGMLCAPQRLCRAL